MSLVSPLARRLREEKRGGEGRGPTELNVTRHVYFHMRARKDAARSAGRKDKKVKPSQKRILWQPRDGNTYIYNVDVILLVNNYLRLGRTPCRTSATDTYMHTPTEAAKTKTVPLGNGTDAGFYIGRLRSVWPQLLNHSRQVRTLRRPAKHRVG